MTDRGADSARRSPGRHQRGSNTVAGFRLRTRQGLEPWEDPSGDHHEHWQSCPARLWPDERHAIRTAPDGPSVPGFPTGRT